MVSRDDVQRYLDAGIAFTAVTRAKAEELVGELVSSGAFPSAEARAKVDELIERSRKSREALVAQVRTEVASQLGSLGVSSLEDLAREVAALINRTAEAGRAAADKGPPEASHAGTTEAPAKTSATKKAPAKKATAKKAPAKKAPAKKATAKKAPAKKASEKKSPAKKATPAGPPTAAAAAPVETTPTGTDD